MAETYQRELIVFSRVLVPTELVWTDWTSLTGRRRAVRDRVGMIDELLSNGATT